MGNQSLPEIGSGRGLVLFPEAVGLSIVLFAVLPKYSLNCHSLIQSNH